MRTAVYVDGFNLYYWLKPLPYRWVDLSLLVQNAIRHPGIEHEIVAIKYFTAAVADTPDDRRKSTRQDVYLRALRNMYPSLTVHLGEFRRQKKKMPKANRDGSVGLPVWVWHTEEKGSDVNLAVELVNDAWANLYDLAVVVSNDSDLERALKISKKKGKTIGVLVRGDAQVNSLKRVSSFIKKLTEQDVRAALLPKRILNTTINIPTEWEAKETAAGIDR